jgi:adenylosuccinate synthase
MSKKRCRIKADFVIDFSHGDCGKGKVTHHLCKRGKYSHVLRFNGGPNAGHTIIHEGRQIITHNVPAGVLLGIRSIIGCGCVVSRSGLPIEIKELEDAGIKVKGNLFIAKNAHVITDGHLSEDAGETRIGTTRRGVGFAYRDKYGRTGIRAEDVPEFEPYLIDLYEELHGGDEDLYILCEGAQGFGLDIDWGDYPFVTSSHVTLGSALLNGVPHTAIRKVWGVAKMYETYVGTKEFQPKGQAIFDEIREAGQEYGATTGRPRQCNWLNWDMLEMAIKINAPTHMVFNKADVLRKVGRWAILLHGNEVGFNCEKQMKDFLIGRLTRLGLKKTNIHFSYSKDKI